MPLWLQHLLVLSLVGGCFALVARQGFRSLLGKRSKLGSCCAKGCQSQSQPTPSIERVVFLPVESLSRRRK